MSTKKRVDVWHITAILKKLKTKRGKSKMMRMDHNREMATTVQEIVLKPELALLGTQDEMKLVEWQLIQKRDEMSQ